MAPTSGAKRRDNRVSKFALREIVNRRVIDSKIIITAMIIIEYYCDSGVVCVIRFCERGRSLIGGLIDADTD